MKEEGASRARGAEPPERRRPRRRLGERGAALAHRRLRAGTPRVRRRRATRRVPRSVVRSVRSVRRVRNALARRPRDDAAASSENNAPSRLLLVELRLRVLRPGPVHALLREHLGEVDGVGDAPREQALDVGAPPGLGDPRVERGRVPGERHRARQRRVARQRRQRRGLQDGRERLEFSPATELPRRGKLPRLEFSPAPVVAAPRQGRDLCHSARPRISSGRRRRELLGVHRRAQGAAPALVPVHPPGRRLRGVAAVLGARGAEKRGKRELASDASATSPAPPRPARAPSAAAARRHSSSDDRPAGGRGTEAIASSADHALA